MVHSGSCDPSDCLLFSWLKRRFVVSDPDEEVEAERGGDVQRLQAESGGRVREEDGERLLGVHQQLRRVVPDLETILDRQMNMQVRLRNSPRPKLYIPAINQPQTFKDA